MCDVTTLVKVKIPADLSSTGHEKWREMMIDSCIADLVLALQEGGVDMRGSCCGHETEFGAIGLQDGRVLVITDCSYYRGTGWPWALKAVLWAIQYTLNYWKRLGKIALINLFGMDFGQS